MVLRQLPPLEVIEAGMVALDRVDDDRAGTARRGKQALERLEHLRGLWIEVRHALDKEGVDHVDQEKRGGLRAISLPSRPSRRRSAKPSATSTRMTTR